jgi:REP element-mobilizing transposase RayT
VPVGSDSYIYRRNLPHLLRRDKTYFITFRTLGRRVLAPVERDLVLKSCVHDHPMLCWIHCALVMPDHVHLILKPNDDVALSRITCRIKSSSAQFVNRLDGRRGSLWQKEVFDHILRSDESLREKIAYVCNNPVRAGLVERWEDYPWIWSSFDERAKGPQPH